MIMQRMIFLASIPCLLTAAPTLAQDDGFWDFLSTDEEAQTEAYGETTDTEYDDEESYEEYFHDDEYAESGEGQDEYSIEACTTPNPSRQGMHRSCGKDATSCTKWNPPLSDRCRNIDIDRYVDVDFEFFGKSDCRSSERTSPVNMIVLHTGGSGKLNSNVWLCRQAASHYTVNRDGTIYQHVGEERRAWHAGQVNDKSIGIELETEIHWQGERCNKLKKRLVERIAKRDGQSPEDVVQERCEPTDAQYAALDDLIYDIESRHEITDIVGHCEVDSPGGASHSDPRAFDWSRIGMSNDEKLKYVQSENTSCDWYRIHQDAEYMTDSE